jgi:Undecaprenyl-phosphate galactose phosphotransferase WbaP
MSTPAMAPERQPLPVDQNQLTEQQHAGRPRSSQLACGVLLILTDVAAIALALKIAIFTRIHLLPHLDNRLSSEVFSFRHYLAVSCWMCLVLVVFLGVEGLYTQRRSLWNEIGRLLKAVGLGLAAILAVVALAQLSPVVSRGTIILTAVNLFVLLPLVRYWAKWLLGRVGLWRKRILVLGAASTARLAIQGISSDPVLGYEVVGLLDDDPLKKGKCIGMCSGKPTLVLGSLDETLDQMACTRAKDVLIAMPGLSDEKLLDLVHMLQSHCESIYVVPRLWGLPMMNLQVDGFLQERVMMLKLSNNLAKPWNNWLKRSLDLMLGSVCALLLLPVGLVLAVLVKLDSEGPSLFVQERLGYHGRTFRCLKFRTMLVAGDEKLLQYLESNPEAADEWRTYAKLRGYDPRWTRLGRFLRRWSLDELPQLINVLKGEMSLIGPRPYLPQERCHLDVNFSTILSARPGMTGLWQVNGRNHLTIAERVQLEAWYVRNWTVWLDCIILAKTFKVLASPQNGTAVPSAQRCSTTPVSRALNSCDLQDFDPV